MGSLLKHFQQSFLLPSAHWRHYRGALLMRMSEMGQTYLDLDHFPMFCYRTYSYNVGNVVILTFSRNFTVN